MTLKNLIPPALIVVIVILVVFFVYTGTSRKRADIKNDYFGATLIEDWRANLPLADSHYRIYLREIAPKRHDYGLIADLFPDIYPRLSFLGDSILLVGGPSEMEDVFLKLPPTALGRTDFNFRDSDSPFYVREWPAYRVDSVAALTAYVCTVPSWPKLRGLRVRHDYNEYNTWYYGFLFGPSDSLAMDAFVGDTIKLIVFWTGESQPQRLDLIHNPSSDGPAFRYVLL